MEWNSSIVKIKYEKLLFDLPVDIFIFISAAYISIINIHLFICSINSFLNLESISALNKR